MYPPVWREAHLTGDVIVVVTVTAGRVVGTHVRSGEPHLLTSTISNLKTWRFADVVNGSFTVTYHYEISGKQSDTVTNPKIEMLPSLRGDVFSFGTYS
jgi:hypothetical protein